MPNTNAGRTYAGSANWSDTATVVSDLNSAVDRLRGTNRIANNNPSAGSRTDDGPRYASAEDGGAPNGGLVPGTYLDKRTNRIFSVGFPPLALPSHLRPSTSQTPFVRLRGFQDLGPLPNSSLSSHRTADSRLFQVGSASTPTSRSNPQSGSQQGSGRA